MKYTLVLALLAAIAPTTLYANDAGFTPVQTELFSTAGSLSNAWADFDNDGDLDFAVSIKGGELRLYRNDGNTFVSVGKAMGLPIKGDELRGVSWGDYDSDGDLDILAGSNVYPIPSRSYVYRNDSSQGFTEVAEALGLAIPGRYSRQSNWIDYDGDGDSDLYAANRAGGNRLFRNDDGQFTGLGFASGTVDSRRTVGACWFDADTDGDLDLFLTNQSGDSDALMRNDGNRFVDIAPELDMHQTLRSQAEGGVGCAIGDYDNDGDFDLYVATYGANLLYQNNGDGTFDEVAKTLGLTEPDHTVGAAWGDYDNDGYLDLIAVGYQRIDGVQVPFSKLYRNTGKGFAHVDSYPEVLAAGDHGVEWVDFDEDGDLDLSVTDGYGSEGGHYLFRNELPEDARAHMLSILVLDQNGHYTQQGAEVRIFSADNRILASRLVPTGGGYNAQSARPVYFAITGSDPVSVEVTYMGAAGYLKQRLNNVSVGGSASGKQTILIRRAPSQ
ncbi:MAG: VCBS repeat-containing protein [Pseudomonadota bacterium]